MPNEDHPSVFDRFAERATALVSGAVFFILCVLLVVIWAPTYFLLHSLNTWQLIINTITTIVTFLLVALLQNSQQRVEKAMNIKLDAIAEGLADLLAANDQSKDVAKLRESVGAESTGSS
ncbi:MAG TPA: low affinity iron permease family protein [Gaiellaceae bacterium]